MSDINWKKKDTGQFFTPKPIVRVLLDHTVNYFPTEYSSKKITIFDPAMGKGIFFSTLIPLIFPLIPSATLFGMDIDSSVIKVANQELIPLVSGSSYDLILRCGNFFLNYPSDIPTKDFEVIIGNPPHNARLSQLEWEQIRRKCKFGQNTKIRSESSIFFTLKSLDLLKKGGILCYVLPKPIIYSKRWSEFRKILLTKFKLVEVVDLGNQFPGQLQEQCAVIVKRLPPNPKGGKYQTGIWNPNKEKLEQMSLISYSDALKVDNLLVGVSRSELKLIRRLYEEEYEFLNVVAFRGLSSKYRAKIGTTPLIEKANVNSGFLLPPRSYLKANTPKQRILRQQVPKVIAQRIISYRTKPTHSLDIKTWVDQTGSILTHETVINIIPNYSQEVLSLTAIAGLLKSSFIEWWLRHVVYTKVFETSKDFDRAYINLIRIPQINDTKSLGYRRILAKLLELNHYEKIIAKVEIQTDIDKLYTLGEIYSKYQTIGENLKKKTFELIQDQRIQPLIKDRTEFQILRWLYKQLSQRKDITGIFKNSSLTERHLSSYIEPISAKYRELQKLQTYMDEIVFLIYKITPNEQKLIKGEIT